MVGFERGNVLFRDFVGVRDETTCRSTKFLLGFQVPDIIGQGLNRVIGCRGSVYRVKADPYTDKLGIKVGHHTSQFAGKRMIITSATPQELVNWFHMRQEEQRILCVMLAPAEDDQQKMAKLVANLYETDAVLGEEIALLLLHPSATTPLGLDNGSGRFATLRGSAFPSASTHRGVAYPLRDNEVFRNMSREVGIYRQDIADKSSRAMALFVPEFMKLFAAPLTELPALCVLVKGLNESAVLPLGKDWSPDSLLELLSKIRSAAENLPNFQVEYQSLADAKPEKIIPVTEAKREIEAKINHITEILERIVKRYQGTERDSTLVADFLAQGCSSTEQLQHVLGCLSFRGNGRYLKDGQVSKVVRLMERVETVRVKLDVDLSACRYVLSVSDRARQLVERREQLFQAISGLRGARFTTTSKTASTSLGRVRSMLEDIDLAGDHGEKFLTAINWVRLLIGM